MNILLALLLVTSSLLATPIKGEFNLFLVMGLTRQADHWPLETRSRIKEYLPQANVIFMDLPGAGVLSNVTAPKNILDYVDIMREQYKTDIENGLPNVVVATSLSGMVIFEWAKKYPKDFAKVTFSATGFKGICKFSERVRPKNIPKMLRIFLAKDQAKKERLIYSVNSWKPIPDETLKRYLQIAKDKPMSKESMWNQTMAGKKYKYTGGRMEAELMILASAKDQLMKQSCHKKMAETLGATHFFLHETAKHGLPLDGPEFMLEKQIEFLKN